MSADYGLVNLRNKLSTSMLRTPVRTTTKRSRTSTVLVNRRGPRKGSSIKGRGPMISRNYFRSHSIGFPNHQTENIRWNTTIGNTTLATVTYVERTYVLNGPYDPDGGASAGQPAGWTKLMAVYTKCVVRNARITVDFMNVVNTEFPNLSVGITLTTNTTTLGTLGGAISPGFVTFQTMGEGTTNLRLTQDVNSKTFLGVSELTGSSGAYNCTPAANPSEVIVAHVWLYNHYGATAIYGLNITVDFDCDFYDPIPVT